MEGLWLMFKEGTYYLFYSASAFQLPTYRMMVARSDSLLGPYVKGHFSNIQILKKTLITKTKDVTKDAPLRCIF